jgi:hypothetical protein
VCNGEVIEVDFEDCFIDGEWQLFRELDEHLRKLERAVLVAGARMHLFQELSEGSWTSRY